MRYIYDLSKAPASCDFLTWLAICSAHNLQGFQQHKREWFEVAFLPGPNHGFRQDDLEPKDIDMRVALFDNILLPACRLYPIRSILVFPEEVEGYENVPYIAGALRQFGVIPSNSPPEWARRLVREWNPEPPVVLNIRDCGYHDSRNSNRREWEQVRSVLEKNYPVVWVDDFGKEAKYFSIVLRAALYEYAHAVLGVNNGPLILCKLNSNATYALFKPIAPTVASTPDWWATKLATPPGSKGYPWAYPNQQIIWEEDTADVIIEAFEKLPKEKSGKPYLVNQDLIDGHDHQQRRAANSD